MAVLSVAVTVVIAFSAPAALPPDQSQTWASGRYLDGMAVSLVALVQMTSNVFRAGTAQAQAVGVAASALRPGQLVAVAASISWQVWVPEAFEVYWTELQFFNPASQPPPAGVTAVETPWPAARSAPASWPRAPAGWRAVASSQAGGWVLWQQG